MSIEAPQIMFIILISMRVGLNLAKHGESLNTKYSFPSALVHAAIMGGLLYWGGFFG